MKRLVLFFSLLSMVLVSSRAVAEVREFTTNDGKAIFGEITDYDAKTDAVKIKTDQGKTIQTKASSFLDEDFMYIRDWDTVRLFSQNVNFRIYLNGPESLNKWAKFRWLERPGKVQPSKTHEIFLNRMGYEIKFSNETGYDLENVEIKYCIFYNQERLDWATEKKVTDLKVRPSVHRYAIVPEGINKKFSSNSIVLRRKEIQGSNQNNRFYFLEGEGRRIKSELIGIVFRAEIITATGHSAVREIRMPKDLSEKYVWVEPTEENTVWPDDELDEREDTKKPPTPFEAEGGLEDDED
jgi:hypothetical protein